MKGKHKCNYISSKPPIPYDARTYGDWDGDFGNVRKRQQHTRQWRQNPTASYDDNVSFHGFGGVGGPIVLDFESSSVRQPSADEDIGNLFGSYKRPRFLPDDRYDCLFRQSGSVETQGECSAAAASKKMSYCHMDLLPYSQSNVIEAGEESHTVSQDSSSVLGHKKGQVVLDFESSSVLMPSADGHVSSDLSQDTRGDGILVYSHADVYGTGIQSHTTAYNSSFVSDQYNQQSGAVDTQGESYTQFVTHKKRRSGVQKQYGRRGRHMLGQIAVTDDAGSSNALSIGVSSLYMDIGDCQWSCEHCNAKFWYGERLKGYSKDLRPHYHKCCSGGKVVLRDEREPPEYIKLLYGDRDFLKHIRVYNQMFSMTSFGAHVDESINNGRGPYVFKISGQIYHSIGTLCPFVGDPPRFLQLYIYDTENEVSNRMQPFGGTQSDGLNKHTVEGLMHVLDECNELVRLFRTARDKCNGQQIPDFKIRLYSVVGAREYDLPTSQTLGAIVFEYGQNTETDYDVIIESKDGFPQRINKLHSSYMSLQFPLIFVYGQAGFHTEMKLRMAGRAKRLSMSMFYMYQLHERFDSYGLLFRTGRLFQQYVVGVYCCIEKNRTDFYRQHQADIRKDYLSGIYDAISRGDREGYEIGSRIILPTSFTGGPRYMYSHYLDALAICRVLGNPQYFITFTCNVNWPEIKRHMDQYPRLLPGDRADVVVRVFEQKVHDFCKYLSATQLFGTVTGLLYTIEFQKRGLPHCHTLLWVDNKDKIQDSRDVDRYISAELPDPKTDPEGYRIVSEMMVHGPCGLADPSASCMKENICSKKFPKKFNNETYFDKNGYVYYRRRDTGVEVTRRGMDLDNSHVVPYNRQLCLAFHAHINVEYCGWSMLIKYLFKYISKGPDKTVAQITRAVGSSMEHVDRREIHIDEIQNFVDRRFICPHEACWRIFQFEIHSRYPAVQILSVHLENKQLVTFRDIQPLEFVANNDGKKMTTLTEWLKFNKFYQTGRHLTYLDFPKELVWYADSKSWRTRRKRRQESIGRLVYVHPNSGELFYLRMLLCHQKGCTSFEDIRTVNHKVCTTFRSACDALGLLGDDKEWDTALEEACFSSTASELRSLFAQILIFCDVSDPLKLWKKYWQQMCDDIPKRTSNDLHIPNLYMNDPELEGTVLYELQAILDSHSKVVTDFGLPPLSERLLKELKNKEMMEEKSYNREELAEEVVTLVPKLNLDQKKIYDLIMDASAANRQELIFVYGHGGTGKTFLWRTIINCLRSHGKIVLAVASSGIASLLLPSGRTAHSRFKLPLELTDESICGIKKNTHVGQLLAKTDLIIWDESPMNDRRCFETLDRTLKDIMDAPNQLFGGKSIVLGGDFRQTLPVKKGASKVEIIASSIAESELWRHFKICTLRQNMRLMQPFQSEEQKRLSEEFAKWLLDIGNGKIGEADACDPQSSSWVQIPEKYCIPDNNDGISKLINFIYDDNTLQNPTAQELQQKAIVCPRNETADSINTGVLRMIRGESIIYKSSDEAIPFKNDGGAVDLLYPMEYLNTLQFSGFPPHELELKVGTPIMLLRNLNLQGGMCNGTRMIVKKMWSRLIEAHVITGNRVATMTVNCISDLSPTAKNKILEARVYRKWILKKPRKPAPIDYCCILIDREGNAIQANMGKSDIPYFSSILLDGAAYRISKFMCTPTGNYQQTIDTETTLRFGRYTTFENIPADAFPKHYFHFTSYNQLGTNIQRQDTTTAQRQPTLTDYIGCLIRVGDVQTFGSAASNITIVRKLDIENLNGDVVELTLWDEMAKGFNKREFELMAGPVIFAVSSCRVSEYNNRVQLLGTFATHYYFNPEIPELEDLQTRFAERFNLHPPLEISKIKFEDPAKEKNRNRYPLSTLLQQNPNNYRGVRFTAPITVAGINTARDWYYKSCTKCPRKIEDGDEPPICPDHGPQPNLAYRYNFKAFVSDHSGTTTFTFFTPNADVLTGHECSELVKKYNMPSPHDFPTEILSIKGRQHIFQFHFNLYSETGKVDFYFDDILDKPLQNTGTDMPALKTTGTCTEIETTVSGTPAITPPLEDIAANLDATSTPAGIEAPKVAESAIMTRKGDPEHPRNISTRNEASIKRALFKDEPSSHKKKKDD